MQQSRALFAMAKLLVKLGVRWLSLNVPTKFGADRSTRFKSTCWLLKNAVPFLSTSVEQCVITGDCCSYSTLSIASLRATVLLNERLVWTYFCQHFNLSTLQSLVWYILNYKFIMCMYAYIDYFWCVPVTYRNGKTIGQRGMLVTLAIEKRYSFTRRQCGYLSCCWTTGENIEMFSELLLQIQSPLKYVYTPMLSHYLIL